jgi:hypothetical protein
MRSPAITARTRRHPVSPALRPATPPQNPSETVAKPRTERIASLIKDPQWSEDSYQQHRQDAEEEEPRLGADDLHPSRHRDRLA